MSTVMLARLLLFVCTDSTCSEYQRSTCLNAGKTHFAFIFWQVTSNHYL